MSTKTNQVSKTYKAVEKNIYQVGKSFRVRVNGLSAYKPNITQARKTRALFMKAKTTNEPVY